MGADGPDCHFHQHSAGGDFYESSGLFLAARCDREDSLTPFDRHIFESIVEKVIVGGYDSNGNKDPYMIVFVYKGILENNFRSMFAFL